MTRCVSVLEDKKDRTKADRTKADLAVVLHCDLTEKLNEFTGTGT